MKDAHKLCKFYALKNKCRNKFEYVTPALSRASVGTLYWPDCPLSAYRIPLHKCQIRIVRIFRSVSRFEICTVQAKLYPIFCIAGIQGKSQGNHKKAENIALINRYLGGYRYFLRKKPPRDQTLENRLLIEKL